MLKSFLGRTPVSHALASTVSSKWLAPLACLFALAFTAPTRAQRPPTEGEAVEMFDYVVVAGDSCSRISRRFYGNGRRYDIIHAYNPEMGPPPHHLVPGTVLHLPRTAVSADHIADARVTARERAVTAHPGGEEAWRDAPLGLELFRGWHLSTEERSSAELTFADTSVLALRADTLVIIFGDSSRAVRRGGTEARVERGSFRSALGELRGGDAGGGNALHVVTSSAQLDMRGGSAVVSVDDAGTSRVSAHEGSVTVADAGGRGRTTVPEGMGSSVASGARPTRPQPLPAAPTLDAGALRFLAIPGRGGDVAGSWQPVANARVYRVEIARQASGRYLAAAVEVPSDVTNFELHGLPAGHYFVRLATIDGDFFESRPSAPVEFVVEDAMFLGPDGSPISVPAIDPSEEPAPVVLHPGSRVALPEGVTCSSGSGELTFLPGPQPTCADASGAPVALPSHAVPALEVSLEDTALERGRVSHLMIRPESDDAPIPPGSTLRGTGVNLTNVRYAGGALEGDAEVPPDAGERAVIEVVAADGTTVLSAIPVTLTAPPAEEPEPEPAPEVVAEEPAPAPARRRAMLTAVGAPFASSVSLRAHDTRGVGAALSMAGVDEGEDGARLRTAFEAVGTLLDDQLRLSLTVPVDVAGRVGAESWRRGSTDIVASAGWIFGGERDPISVLVDLGVWLPTNSTSSIGTARFNPSLELAWAVSPGFALRTRQSAILELSDTGTRRWASAYGLDLLLAGPLGVIIEADLSIGDELGSRPLDAAFAAAFTLDLDLVGLSLGGRFGPLGGDVFAPAEVHITFRGTAP